jgi:hypothetical protein
LIAVDESDGVHWRVGYNNFFVITRYNHSALYAMAVYELATAVKQRMLENDAAQLAASTSAATPTPAATSTPAATPTPAATSTPATTPTPAAAPSPAAPPTSTSTSTTSP